MIDEAEAEIEIAKNLDPNDGKVYFTMSSIFRDKGELEKAETVCKHGLKLSPSNSVKIRYFFKKKNCIFTPLTFPASLFSILFSNFLFFSFFFLNFFNFNLEHRI